MQRFLNWIATSNEKWILYNNQLSGETKKKFQSTFQSKLAPKKDHGHCLGLLPDWSTTAFWICTKPLHLRNMLSKLMRCNENCNTYSQHWPTGRAQFFSMTTPNCPWHNQCFKSWMNLAMKFYVLCHIYLTSCQSLLQATQLLFAGKMLLQPAGGRMLSKSLSNPKA